MDEVTVTLSSNDLGQLINGLDVLIEQWSATADYLENGKLREDVCIRESNDPQEARSIAEHYKRIREVLIKQQSVGHAGRVR